MIRKVMGFIALGTLTLAPASYAQRRNVAGVIIPVQYRGTWAPDARACNPGREQTTVVERGGIEITANSINTYEYSLKPIAAITSSSGSFAFKATIYSEGEAGASEAVNFRIVGQALTLRHASGGRYNRSYVRCGAKGGVAIATASETSELSSLGGNSATSPPPQVGRCHMGECSWSRELSRAMVRSDRSGKLIRLSLLGGSSPMNKRNAPVRWQRSPHEVYVFCSTALPSVIFPDGRAMQVDVLNFDNGVPGFQESAANIYVNTCHGSKANWNSDGFAGANGYRAVPEQFQQIEIRSPGEIFEVARRASRERPVRL